MEKWTIYSQFQHGQWNALPSPNRHGNQLVFGPPTSPFASTLARHSVVHLSAVCCWIWGLEGLLRSLEMPGKLTMLADERRMNGSMKSC
jgi:hypothetical protein